MRTETDRNASNTGTGDKWTERNADLAQDDEHRNRPDHDRHQALEQLAEGDRPLPRPIVGVPSLGDQIYASAKRPNLEFFCSTASSASLGNARSEATYNAPQHAHDDPCQKQHEQDAQRPTDKPIGEDCPHLTTCLIEHPLTNEARAVPTPFGQRVGDDVLSQKLLSENYLVVVH